MAFWKFVLAMVLSFLPGLLGLFFSPIQSGQNLWYNTLNNSFLTPDGWVFSVVWTILYFLIGIALFLVMQRKHTRNEHDKAGAYTAFGINIVLNFLWSFVFFGAHLPEAALIILTALIITAIFMSRAFYRVSQAAFWLVIPYIIWLMFAFYLNAMIIYLN